MFISRENILNTMFISRANIPNTMFISRENIPNTMFVFCVHSLQVCTKMPYVNTDFHTGFV